MTTQPTADSQNYRFTLGSFDCVAISDGAWTYPIENLFSNISRGTVVETLRRRNLPIDGVTTPYTCLFVNTGEHRVMVDVGVGDFWAPTLIGALAQNLKAGGIEPAEIDTVIITHAHPDHIGGNLGPNGKPLYPNARYFIWKGEWDFWNSDLALAKWEHFTRFAHQKLDPVQDKLVLLDGEQQIVPGIDAVAAPGHTPGHMAVSICSGREQLLHISDTVLSPLHLEHPDWVPIYDIQPEEAAASKRRIFDRAVTEQALVFAHHFPPFPNLGYVIKRGDGWQWRSIHGAG